MARFSYSPFFIKWLLLIAGLPLLFLLLTKNSFGDQTARDWYEKASELSLKGTPKRAIQAYLETLAIDPEFAEAHHGLAVLYFEKREEVRAIDHFRKAENLYRERSDSLAKRNLLIVKKNLAKAYESLDLDPEDFEEVPGYSLEPEWAASGVGFFFGVRGFILTSYHAVQEAGEIRVRLHDGRTIPSEVTGNFIVHDVAVLSLKEKLEGARPILTFGDSSELSIGDRIFAVDFDNLKSPGNIFYEGSLLAREAMEGNPRVFHLELKLEDEQSGGPLFNEKGEVVGVTFSKYFADKFFIYREKIPEGTSFAFKSSYLQPILAKFLVPQFESKAAPSPERLPIGKPSGSFRHSPGMAGNFVRVEISQ